MGCPELTWSDYIRPVEPAEKTAYSRISHKVTDDPIGNRIRYQDVSYAYNKLNQITSMSDAGQGSPFPFHYDNWGNLVKTPEWTYKFDLQNRLVEAKSPKVTVKYSYDPLGQRIKSEEITTKGTKSTRFLMSGMVEQARLTSPRPLGEGKGEGGEAMFHTMGLDLADSLKKTGGVGAYLASSCGSVKDVYLYDGNGNVSATTDADGDLKDKMVYSPFGKMESGKELAFGFSSKAFDKSGLSYYGYRFYSVELGRWLKRDPNLELGGMNLNVIVANNPLNNIDYKGLAYEWAPQSYWEDGGKTGEYVWDTVDTQSYSLSFTNKTVNQVESSWQVTASVSGNYDALGVSSSFTKTYSTLAAAEAAGSSSFSFSFLIEEKLQEHILWVSEWNTYYVSKCMLEPSCNPGDVRLSRTVGGYGGLVVEYKCGQTSTLRRITPNQSVKVGTTSTGEFRMTGDKSGTGTSAAALRVIGENAAKAAAATWYNAQ